MAIASMAALFLSSNWVQSQDQLPKDTTQVTQLNEVVVTGENKVMSLSKKLFAVGTIQKEDIAQIAGNNLADLLHNNLNITIIPDPATGRSTISMFGLDGQYIKILMDGIPMASDNGIGNNIDITQINLEDVERIEIVEGSMGVLYGDNAVAGVINIVTKRGFGQHKWELRASVQEETVGNEYALFDKGRHIQNLKVKHNLNDNLNITAGVSRNDYAGFYNDYQGRNYVNINEGTVVNDGLRGMEWNPKNQLTAFANADLHLNTHQLFYKFQYYNEEVDVYDHKVNGRLDPATGEPNPTAADELFTTHRIMNNINMSGPLLGRSTYNLSLSYQDQKRYYEKYVYNILQQGIASYITDALDQSSKIWYSKGFVNNLFPEKNPIDLQLGYEITHHTGYDATATGNYSSEVVKNTLGNYDVFGVADIDLNEHFSIYPGFRYITNSQFGNHLIGSISTNYRFNKTLLLKAIVGSAFRSPNFEELFYYFVDSNHNVQGNPDLDPEDGISIFLNLENIYPIGEKGYLKSAIKSYYFDINNKIAFVNRGDDEGMFTYHNIDRSKILGFSWENNLSYNQWQIGLGATYMGESSALISSDKSQTDYLWSLNTQVNLSYTLPELKSILSAQIKYNGKSQVFMEENDELTIKSTNPFTWVDVSIRTELSKNLEAIFGARNLLDIVTVKANDISSGGHGGSAPTTRLFGNGRSYFLKLLYNLNLN